MKRQFDNGNIIFLHCHHLKILFYFTTIMATIKNRFKLKPRDRVPTEEYDLT